MPSTKSKSETISSYLDAIESAADLKGLNDYITGLMRRHEHHAVVKGEHLWRVVDAVVGLAHKSTKDDTLFAAAALGRIARVAGNRESQVYDRVADLQLADPPSVETLATSDEKTAAARSIVHLTDEWVSDYLIREVLEIDTAENARNVLLEEALKRHGTLSDLLVALESNPASAIAIDSLDSRLKRVRRILNAIANLLHQWRGELGHQPGIALAELVSTLLKGKLDGVDSKDLYKSFDYCLAVTTRIIELRFSIALSPDTYVVVEQGKKILGPGVWGRFLGRSENIANVRTALLEAALVLARQNRTDKRLVAVMLSCYTSRPQVSAAVKRHFKDAGDLVPDVAEFWIKVGEVTGPSQIEQKVGNSEDEQIGALLIEVESSQEVMNKLDRAVAPIIEISDPVTASTVKRAAQGYKEIAQIVRRLARIRKLTPIGMKGKRLEYNALEQQLLGGHKPGVRQVRVVRDGIRKTFGKRKRTLVKPWVQQDD